MKELHAYRNEDGTYKLDIVADYYDKGEWNEVHVIYECVDIKNNGLTFDLNLEINADGRDYYVKL